MENTYEASNATNTERKSAPVQLTGRMSFGKGMSMGVSRNENGFTTYIVKVPVKKDYVSIYTNNDEDASCIVRMNVTAKTQDIMIAVYSTGAASIYKDGNVVFRVDELTADQISFMDARITTETAEKVIEAIAFLMPLAGDVETINGRA